MYKIVLIRHGESQWNKENRFTGWKDIDLSDKGRTEAQKAGELLKSEGFVFDIAFTSVLKRAIRTLWLVLDQMDLMWVPVIRSWRLNERHYGSLQGLNKAETAAKHGDEQVHIWRRSYSTPPPALEINDERHPRNDVRYKYIDPNELPSCEALKHTVDRFLPCWELEIIPQIEAGKNVLIVAHGNSLRSLVKILDQKSEDEIMKINIPTGIPLIYELDEQLKPIKSYYLGDQEEIQKAMQGVANQGKSASQ